MIKTTMQRTFAPTSRRASRNWVALLKSAQVSAVPCNSTTRGSDAPHSTPCHISATSAPHHTSVMCRPCHAAAPRAAAMRPTPPPARSAPRQRYISLNPTPRHSSTSLGPHRKHLMIRSPLWQSWTKTGSVTHTFQQHAHKSTKHSLILEGRIKEIIQLHVDAAGGQQQLISSTAVNYIHAFKAEHRLEITGGAGRKLALMQYVGEKSLSAARPFTDMIRSKRRR